MTTKPSQSLRVAGEAAERLAARGIACRLELVGSRWTITPKGRRAISVGPDSTVANVIAGAFDGNH